MLALLMFWEDRGQSKCLLLCRQPLSSINKYIFWILPPQLNLFPSLHLHNFNLLRPSASATRLTAAASSSVSRLSLDTNAGTELFASCHSPDTPSAWRLKLKLLNMGYSFLHDAFTLPCCSGARSCPALCNPMDCSTPGLPVLHQLLELDQTHVHRVGGAIQPTILCCPLLLLPSIFPSIGVFSSDSALPIQLQWILKLHSPSSEHSGLVSFRMDWLDLTVQGLSRVFSNTALSLCSSSLGCLLQLHWTSSGSLFIILHQRFACFIQSEALLSLLYFYDSLLVNLN